MRTNHRRDRVSNRPSPRHVRSESDPHSLRMLVSPTPRDEEGGGRTRLLGPRPCASCGSVQSISHMRPSCPGCFCFIRSTALISESSTSSRLKRPPALEPVRLRCDRKGDETYRARRRNAFDLHRALDSSGWASRPPLEGSKPKLASTGVLSTPSASYAEGGSRRSTHVQ